MELSKINEDKELRWSIIGFTSFLAVSVFLIVPFHLEEFEVWGGEKSTDTMEVSGAIGEQLESS